MPGIEDVNVDYERLREVCTRYGIVRLRVFGSISRGEDGKDSDIDLLYTVAPGVRLGYFKLFAFVDELEAILGRKADLVSENYVHPLMREKVLSDARPFYAA